MHLKRGWTLATSILILLGLAQVVAIVWVRRPAALVGPVPGRPLPDVGPVRIDGKPPLSLHALVQSRSCTMLVMVSTTCAACRRMRESWTSRLRVWRDSIGVPIRAIWLAGGDSSSVNDFVRGYDLSGTVIARIDDGDVNRVGESLGVYATPTLYLLDHTGGLRFGVLGDVLPPADSGRAACAAVS